MAKLGITQIWYTAWQRFNVHWMAGLGIVFISVLLDFIPVSQSVSDIQPVSNIILIIKAVANCILNVVLLSYGLRAWNSSEALSFTRYFPSLGAILKVTVGLILIFLFASLAAALGYLANMNQVYHTVFLGIFLIGILLLFFTYPCWVIDKGYGIFRGLGAAARLTIHNVGPVFLFILSIIGINFLGGLAFGVGLLVTVPWTMIAMAGLYKSLAGEGSAEAAQAS